VPNVAPVQNRVEVPDPPLMLVELILHNRSDELVFCERETVPENPFSGVMVIVEEPLVPEFTERLAGLTVIAKS